MANHAAAAINCTFTVSLAGGPRTRGSLDTPTVGAFAPTRRHRGLSRLATAASVTISGCRASDTAGESRITSACAPKIATAR